MAVTHGDGVEEHLTPLDHTPDRTHVIDVVLLVLGVTVAVALIVAIVVGP